MPDRYIGPYVGWHPAHWQKAREALVALRRREPCTFDGEIDRLLTALCRFPMRLVVRFLAPHTRFNEQEIERLIALRRADEARWAKRRQDLPQLYQLLER